MRHIAQALPQVISGTTWNDSTAETLSPAARASGTLPMMPITMVVAAAANAVAVVTCPPSRVC